MSPHGRRRRLAYRARGGLGLPLVLSALLLGCFNRQVDEGGGGEGGNATPGTPAADVSPAPGIAKLPAVWDRKNLAKSARIAQAILDSKELEQSAARRAPTDTADRSAQIDKGSPDPNSPNSLGTPDPKDRQETPKNREKAAPAGAADPKSTWTAIEQPPPRRPAEPREAWSPWDLMRSPAEGAGGGGPLSLTEELTIELRALREQVTLRIAAAFGALLALAWSASRLVPWLLRLLVRLGVEPARWLDTLGMLLRLAVWAWVLVTVVVYAWRVAPMLTLLAAVVVVGGLLIGVVRHIENLSTGIGLALRRPIKVGDPVQVGEHAGMVRHIGLMHLQLRTADGSTVYLPNRLLADHPVTIGRARNSYPLRLRRVAAAGWPPEALEVARELATLSPYRDVNSRIAVQTEGDDAEILVVEIQVWSPRLLSAADKHLRAMLDAHLPPQPPQPPQPPAPSAPSAPSAPPSAPP